MEHLCPPVAFRCRDIEELAQCGDAVDLAFQLEVDEWRNEGLPNS